MPGMTAPRRTSQWTGSRLLIRARLADARFAIAVLLPLWMGCVHPQPRSVGLPNNHVVRTDELLIKSDRRIPDDDPLLEELKEVRRELMELFELPPPARPVVVYLFADERRYSEYMQSRHPNLPPRRAFFIGSPTELAVYAHWSPNVMEDLRHEYTHGVLNASLRTVPLWLDEGIAEYFETRTRDPQRVHAEHAKRLQYALTSGWRPDLARLERIDQVNSMTAADYTEAWAWVHYLVHDSPGGRELLVDYCRSLRRSTDPPRFSDRVNAYFPDSSSRLASYIAISLRYGDSGIQRVSDLRPAE